MCVRAPGRDTRSFCWDWFCFLWFFFRLAVSSTQKGDPASSIYCDTRRTTNPKRNAVPIPFVVRCIVLAAEIVVGAVVGNNRREIPFGIDNGLFVGMNTGPSCGVAVVGAVEG